MKPYIHYGLPLVILLLCIGASTVQAESAPVISAVDAGFHFDTPPGYLLFYRYAIATDAAFQLMDEEDKDEYSNTIHVFIWKDNTTKADILKIKNEKDAKTIISKWYLKSEHVFIDAYLQKINGNTFIIKEEKYTVNKVTYRYKTAYIVKNNLLYKIEFRDNVSSYENNKDILEEFIKTVQIASIVYKKKDLKGAQKTILSGQPHEVIYKIPKGFAIVNGTEENQIFLEYVQPQNIVSIFVNSPYIGTFAPIDMFETTSDKELFSIMKDSPKFNTNYKTKDSCNLRLKSTSIKTFGENKFYLVNYEGVCNSKKSGPHIKDIDVYLFKKQYIYLIGFSNVKKFDDKTVETFLKNFDVK